MLTVVYVYVLSDTSNFILLKMVLRDATVNINSTLTELTDSELQGEIQINTRAVRRSSAGDYQSAKRIRLNDCKNSPPVFAENPVRLNETDANLIKILPLDFRWPGWFWPGLSRRQPAGWGWRELKLSPLLLVNQISGKLSPRYTIFINNFVNFKDLEMEKTQCGMKPSFWWK